MPQTRTIFGATVEVETIKLDLVAVGDGWTVTATAVLVGGDPLFAASAARCPATLTEAMSVLAPEAITAVNQWMDSNEKPGQPELTEGDVR